MKCRITYYVVSFVALLVFCFGLSIINSSDVSAVSPLTYNLSISTTVPFYICNDSNASPPHCVDYHYIIIEADNTFNGNAYDTLISGLGSFRVPVYGYSVIEIKDSFSQYGLWFNGINHSFKLTLVDSLDSSIPSGSITLTENGTFDVTDYATAVVDVAAETIPGDYHDDLISIRNCIIACAGVCLVIYFFYCIYRMIIKSSGGY